MKNLLLILSCVSIVLVFALSSCNDNVDPQTGITSPASGMEDAAARTGAPGITGIEATVPYKWQLVKTGIIKKGESLVLQTPFQIGNYEVKHMRFNCYGNVSALEPINTLCLNLGVGTIKGITLEYLKNYPYKTDKIFTSDYPDAFWPVHLYKNSIIACKTAAGENFLLQVKNIRPNSYIEVDVYQAVRLTLSN